ncbi:MAG: helix-hairpin-helix domain-containing protein, partial [Candidatus Hydrogenedentota bacterium]
MIDNTAIAHLFFEMANILEILGENQFKVRAYRNAANVISNHPTPFATIYNKEKFMEIDGIGEAIAGKIIEIIDSGDFNAHRDAKKKIPDGLLEMLKIEGLGPKRVAVLYKELGLKTIDDLKRSAENGSIQKLHGFGLTIQNNILTGIQNLLKSKGRFTLDEVLPVACKIIDTLQKIKGVKEVVYAGSLRRWKETVKDLDILVSGDTKISKRVMDVFTQMDNVLEILQKGDTKSSVKLKNQLQVDLRFVRVDCFGASLQYFTGSKEHNVALRSLAKDRGYKTNEYGLFYIKGKKEKKVAGADEKIFYQKLGMQYIEPELRENTGEIKLALANQLPQLITQSDIQADLQMHTNASDGINTLDEMIQSCIGLGYKYMAITEHSKSVYVARGLGDDELLRWIEK